MLVVSDASPLNLLVRIEHIHVLPTLFGRVIIPTAVAEELSRQATPSVVRDWLASKPSWLEVHAPAHPEDPAVFRHRGEREAISVARELNADLFLVDDRKASRAAQRLGIATVGTLGILERAADQGLLDLQRTFDRIRHETNFFVTDELLDFVLLRHRRQQVSTKNQITESNPTKQSSQQHRTQQHDQESKRDR